ncbi:MAG: polysaccharide biosynthesis tyrosine autokinase [Paludibacteraceae bacterium]|nr:polysaccharide biosynthesis tyrosine autokinase [Paludibacteraceae bacterium]
MSQKEQEIDIRSWIIRILKNWYWFVLSCAVCGAIGAYTYVSTTKKFKVDASIMLREEEEALPNFEMLSSMIGMSSSKTTDDEVELLTSRDILVQVVKELDLQTEYRKYESFKWIGQYPGRDLSVVYPPVYLDTVTRSVRIELKVRKDDYVVKVRYGRWLRSRHKVQDLTVPFETCIGSISFNIHAPQEIEVGDKYRMLTLPQLPLIDNYKRNISASPVRKESNIIQLSTTTDMPIRGRDFIRKEIELYNMDAVLDKNIMASNTAAFIEERLRLIEQELADAEDDVTKYKKRYDIVDLESEAALALHEGAEYRKQVAEIETQLNLVSYVAEYVSDESKKNNLIPANIGINDVALISLISEYNQLMLDRMRVRRTASESNPILHQMESQLAVMRENIVTTINSLTNTLTIAKQDIEARQGKIKSQRSKLPSQEQQYIEVLRNKVLKEELYLFLYKQREENALTLASTVNPAKVVNTPQMNPTPVEPRLSVVGLISLILGLLFPVVVMVMYDIMNNRISDETVALERRLKIPVVGTLVNNHHGNHVAVHEGENSASAELFRTLRTNIRFTQPKDVKCPVLLVTSSVNSEGKSYVATNLAISLSLLGKRVALVGLDIRKPMLAHYLNLPTQGCLTTYVAEDGYTVDDTIVPSGITNNLDILPAGVIPPNPSELLQSERLDELFVQLRERYDYVIVDSAPVAMIGDTYLLGRLADMTVYVTRANYTTFDLVNFINQTAEQQRLPKMMAVLNGADAKKVGYGYGYGYGNSAKGKKK